MANVTFRCGHCNNLMAVTPDSVGRQVRCPHCQQVVQVPAPAPAPVPAPLPAPVPAPPPGTAASMDAWLSALPSPFEVGGGGENESIFSNKKETDDLFGDEPGPQVEMPSATAVVPDLELDPPAPPSIQPEPAAVSALAEVRSADDRTEVLSAVEPAPSPPSPAEQPLAWHPGVESSSALEESLPTPTVRRQASSGLYIPLLIVPLVSYAVLATILLLIVYKENRRLKYEHPHPLEMVPDVEGDNTGVRKNGSRTEVDMPDPEQALPAHLKMKLGEKRTFGNIEVTALRVKKERVTIDTKGKESDTPDEPALLLYLKVRNISTDQSFAPMDEYFVRRYPAEDQALNQVEPYTFLEVGNRKLFGGPAEYRRRRGDPRESVAGANYSKVLGPGEEMTTFVCTDPVNHKLARSLQNNKGQPLLWRVQVRRGLVEFESPYKGKRQVPATAVIGVTFGESDIDRS